MALDFDQFPLYDALIKPGNHMSDIWVSAMSSFYETLIQYLSQFGIGLPNLTTSQRDSIQSPANGQMIYNTTVDAPQFYQLSSKTWKTFNFT